VAAAGAYSARETYRIHLNDLGEPNAIPVDKEVYDGMRARAPSNSGAAKASA